MRRRIGSWLPFVEVAAMIAVMLFGAPALGGDDKIVPTWYSKLTPIVVLLVVIGLVLARLPKVDLGHSQDYLRRRFWNWFPLGLTYALLYFGRYNLNVLKDVKLLTEEQYGFIFGIGAVVYGISFIVNGPLTDYWGGRKSILISAMGAAVANIAMGIAAYVRGFEDPEFVFSVLYGANMYFQSFGAVAIVKVNSAWFHVRERGMIGSVFGILISLGLYFAFDWGFAIVNSMNPWWLFFIPAATLLTFWMIELFLVRDHPSDAGHKDFNTGDASSGDTGPRLPATQVFRMMFMNRIIVIIMLIEFCSGFLRNAIMHWGRDFLKGAGLKETYVYMNWGMLLCVAGILGGMFAGVISDRIFQSRRGPVTAILYALMLAGGLCMMPLMTWPWTIGWAVIFMSMCIIGVHGMLSGTASMDFGGKKNAGVAVGIIDGCVYLGTGLQSIVLGYLLPEKGTPAAADIANWRVWPIVMIPFALGGLLLATRVWNAKPQPKLAAVPAKAVG